MIGINAFFILPNDVDMSHIIMGPVKNILETYFPYIHIFLG